MTIGVRVAIQSYPCLGCGVFITKRPRFRKTYCSLRCWYDRNKNPDRSMRRCTSCGITKDLTEFTDRVSKCKSCRCGATKNYVAKLKRESKMKWLAYTAARNTFGRGGPSITAGEILPLFEKSERCTYCGDRLDFRTMSLDHILPVARGGTNRIENLHIVCMRCNRFKGSLLDVSYRRFLIFLKSISEECARILTSRVLYGANRFSRK